MKTAWSAMLAVLLVLSLSVSAFAAAPGDDQSIDVTAKYDSTTSTPTVYSVDIVWDSMVFTYTETVEKEWNAANHSYTTKTTGAWDKTTATITVTNHSNAEVDVSLFYAAMENTGVAGKLDKTQKTLAAGEEGAYDEADALVTTLTISGTPTQTVTESGITVGSITITLN